MSQRVGLTASPIMANMAALGEFLQARRAALRPCDLGLETDGRRRRVTGLRREELAYAAGVSPAYYTRLEQGLSRNASVEVLDALAQALRLSADERAHLHSLARPRRQFGVHRGPEQIRPSAGWLLDAVADSPAMILNPNLDILAWNRLGHALLAWHLPFQPESDPDTRSNLARFVFLDCDVRGLWPRWGEKAASTVAYLRLTCGRYPDDPLLASLVAELSVGSEDFARLWEAHPVGDCASTIRQYHHPLVGPLVLHEEITSLADPGQILAVYLAEPGSPSAVSLRLLAQLAAPTDTINRSDADRVYGYP